MPLFKGLILELHRRISKFKQFKKFKHAKIIEKKYSTSSQYKIDRQIWNLLQNTYGSIGEAIRILLKILKIMRQLVFLG
jgi:hypothetical protein